MTLVLDSEGVDAFVRPRRRLAELRLRGMWPPHDLAMVEATLTLSHRLGLESVAEGIETEAQWHQLRDLGCDSGQGFLFARPTTSRLVCAEELTIADKRH